MFIFLFHKKMNIRELTYNRRFLVLSDGKHFPSKAIEAARQFAEGFEKSFCLLALCDKPQEAYASQAEAYVSTCPVDLLYSVCSGTLQDVCDMSERTETPIIFVETAKQSMFSNVMTIFKAFRGLRIPYVIIKENCEKIDFSNILVPVTYLPEEKEKAPYSCNMGRFLRSNIIVLQAKDYGSKTPANVKAITAFYDKFNLRYIVRQASKDSYKVEKEAVMKAKAENAGMVVISTSRDYGLDDMVFGPKEEHLFKIAEVPLMCINPRGDLYVLCW